MKKILLKRKSGGYTIIETMIAISLFVIIIMAGMGALLNANLLHQKSKDMRSIIDNLSFVMEDMSRNLRTGYYYHCINDGNVNVTATSDNTNSCPNGDGKGISFVSSNPISQWTYYISDSNSIFKIVDGVSVQLTPDEIVIDSDSFFSVVGAEPPPGDLQQPFVTIKLSGEIIIPSKDVGSPFSLQTSVSQRLIDITPVSVPAP